MRCRKAMTCARYFSVFPQEKMVMVKTVQYGSLTFRFLDESFGASRSVGGTYGMGG
jgi:hypothetical protein